MEKIFKTFYMYYAKKIHLTSLRKKVQEMCKKLSAQVHLKNFSQEEFLFGMYKSKSGIIISKGTCSVLEDFKGQIKFSYKYVDWALLKIVFKNK